MSKDTVSVYVVGSARGCNCCLCVGLCEINRTCAGEWDSGQWTQLRRQLWWGGEEGDRGGMEGSRPSVEGRVPWQPPESEWDLSRPDRWTDRATPHCHNHSPGANSSPQAESLTCSSHKLTEEWRNGHLLVQRNAQGEKKAISTINTPLLAHRPSSITFTKLHSLQFYIVLAAVLFILFYLWFCFFSALPFYMLIPSSRSQVNSLRRGSTVRKQSMYKSGPSKWFK